MKKEIKTKKCNAKDCQLVKPVSEFNFRSRAKQTYKHICRDCERKVNKLNNARHYANRKAAGIKYRHFSTPVDLSSHDVPCSLCSCNKNTVKPTDYNIHMYIVETIDDKCVHCGDEVYYFQPKSVNHGKSYGWADDPENYHSSKTSW